MKTIPDIRERIEKAFEPTARGVLGLVNELLRLACEYDLTFEWHEAHCHVRVLGGASPEEFELPLPQSVFRAVLVNGLLGETEHDRADQPDAVIEPALPRPVRYSPERRFSPRRQPRSRLALSSGILGIVALALLIALPFMYLIVSMLKGDEWLTVSLLGGHVGAVLLGGLLAIALGIAALVVLNRQGGRLVGHGWAITGLCTGPLPMFAGGLVALVVGSQLWSTISMTPVYSTSPTVPPPGPIAANPYGDPLLAPPGAVPSTSLSIPPSNAGWTPDSDAPPSYPVPTGLPPRAESPAVAPTYAQQAASNEPPPAPDAPSAVPNPSAPTPPSDVGSRGDHP